MNKPALVLGLLGCLASTCFAAAEPVDVREAKENCVAERTGNAHAYYRAQAICEGRLIREHSATFQKTADAAGLASLAADTKRLQELKAIHEFFSRGPATFRIAAREPWRATIPVQAGDVVQASAVGVWCSAINDRTKHTFDADGQPGKNFAYLEGKIDDGRAFKVGKSAEFTATQDGDLSFDMHDSGKKDNDGVLTLSLYIIPPATSAGAPTDQKAALVAYYKANAVADERLLKVLVTALLRTRDMDMVTTLSQDINKVREDLTLDDAIARGSKSYKIEAKKHWQPTIPVTAGMTVHVRAAGLWCANIDNRQNSTIDADGGPLDGYLEARVGPGEGFRVGRAKSFKVTESGVLEFDMLAAIHSSSEGALTVYISTDPAPLKH